MWAKWQIDIENIEICERASCMCNCARNESHVELEWTVSCREPTYISQAARQLSSDITQSLCNSKVPALLYLRER